ncbi:head-tail connector protein [Marininema halotolerans]|uniref:Uncharacterized phage protein (Possible DNA packaging) n=1 Tax=Marininema halotolerans TaxID=1155944 RepID=A0A1I6URQ0_9BACL|nr:head-tail connector protein [Marininema halotolerans]SFT04128.1 uncharacterized phage protein (possible DNA packaging) [Marininema halotolerans]
MLSLDLLKNYLRIDGTEDDELLSLLISSAKEYFKNAGVPETDSDLYTLGIMRYCTLHYENRDPTLKMDEINAALQSIILQLKE